MIERRTSNLGFMQKLNKFTLKCLNLPLKLDMILFYCLCLSFVFHMVAGVDYPIIFKYINLYGLVRELRESWAMLSGL